MELHDNPKWIIASKVEKWHRSEDHDAGHEPDEVEDFKGNLLLNAGIARMLDLLIAAGGQGYDATHSRIGVGDSNTAAVATQTDLQAATNKQWKLVSSATRATQVVTWVATFGTAQANFAWEEWGIDVGTADSTTLTSPMLNRKVQTMGTKASGSTWALTVTLTIA